MRYLSAGESHGKGIVALLDGFPAGVAIDVERIDAELQRRQGGYGRGGRQLIEADRVEIHTGVWKGKSTGAPITLLVKNKDHKIDEMPEIEFPRPGHADLAGAIKYEQPIRPILERSSARETAARVAAGALVRQLLEPFGICFLGYVSAVGPLSLRLETITSRKTHPFDMMHSLRQRSEIFSLVPDKDEEVKVLIDTVSEEGDTLGGIIEAHIEGLPIGLGSCTQWDRKLDARLAAAVMSIQAFKAVEFGLGFECAYRSGSQIHDAIFHDEEKSIHRKTNHAGGIEGGMSNGEPILLRAAMKPIPTLREPLPSVHLHTKQPRPASFERSDVCAVSAASVVLENATALIIADAFCEKFGSDSYDEIRRNYDHRYSL